MSPPRLDLRSITAGYDGAPVIRGVSLSAQPGEIVALLGANGAGKTTTLRATCGLLPVMSGVVAIDGEVVTGATPQTIAQLGLAHVTERRGVFDDLTVAEHLRLAPRGARLEPELAYGHFPALRPLADRRAGLLSGGEQQMLSLARAIARRPRVLLIDELSLGLAPVIVRQLLPVIAACAQEDGCAVVLVEQHVELALGIADRGVVLSHGEIAHSGSAAELRGDRDLVVSSYLGAA